MFAQLKFQVCILDTIKLDLPLITTLLLPNDKYGSKPFSEVRSVKISSNLDFIHSILDASLFQDFFKPNTK